MLMGEIGLRIDVDVNITKEYKDDGVLEDVNLSMSYLSIAICYHI